ncbi:MAG: type II secretion system protein, partial [Verrucomicrobia bacterium]|nr:type II secretion system protein [Verrucomicrobiota bacterium]
MREGRSQLPFSRPGWFGPQASGPMNGFTLVELLTAVAIVGLLAGLGVAGFQHAVSASQTGRCAANLRTMAQAVLAYSADDGGKVPPAMAPATPEESGGAGHRLWIDYLRPYLPPLAGSERQHPYLCPAAHRPGLWNNTCPDYGCNLRWSDAENAGAFAL